MTDAPDPPNGGRDQAGRFVPGHTGNPAGKPRGTRHRALVALDAIGQDAAQAVLERVIADAKQGDMRAADILLRRLWPERKGRPVAFPLPAMTTATDIASALGAVAQAVGAADLTPEEPT